MPGFDGTGPFGAPSWPCRGRSRRSFFGRGFGAGYGCRTFSALAALSDEEKGKILEAELAELDREKSDVEAKLKELRG